MSRRAAQWGHELCLCLERIESTIHHLKIRGLKGATGTQASFLTLLEGRQDKVEALETEFVRRLGWRSRFGTSRVPGRMNV